jgi:hypothetical protein
MMRLMLFVVLVLEGSLVGSVNADLVRSYLFDSQSMPSPFPVDDSTTPDATGNANALMLGPEGILADSGGVVPQNGRLKKAENVLEAIPWGGVSEPTYDGYTGFSDSVAMWFKTGTGKYAGSWDDDWTSLFRVGGTVADLALAKSQNRNFQGGAPTNGAYMQSFSYTGGNSWVSTDPDSTLGSPNARADTGLGVPLDDGNWHHVVRTFSDYDPSGVNPATEIYIDGVLAASGPAAGAAPSGLGLTIGQPTAFGSYFKGLIDNVHVYNHELTAAEVQELYITETIQAGPVPTDYAWGADTSGDWDSEAKWSPTGGPPGRADADNFMDHTATLGDVISSTRTVFSDKDVSLRELTFDSDHGYVVAGSGTMSLVAGTGATSIQVDRGQNEFQSRVSLETDTAVDVASGQQLEFNNRLLLNGNTLTKTGLGTIAVNNILSSGGGTLNCNEGICSGSGTVGGDLNNSGGTLSPGNGPGILTGGSSAAVPEPSCLMMLAVGLATLVVGSRQRTTTR